MTPEQNEIETEIKKQFIEICEGVGENAEELGVDDLIPMSGLIDSAGLLEFIAWYEEHFNISLSPEEITIDNLGSIRLMAEFAMQRLSKN